MAVSLCSFHALFFSNSKLVQLGSITIPPSSFLLPGMLAVLKKQLFLQCCTLFMSMKVGGGKNMFSDLPLLGKKEVMIM